MISKSTISLVASLEYKKYRDERGLFVAEGVKLVSNLRTCLKPYAIFTTITTAAANGGGSGVTLVSEAEMKKISFLKTPSPMLGVFYMPRRAASPPLLPQPGKLTLALDGVQDPGNLGAIIRLCGWFGVDALLCSPDVVDCYNPKVVQASMGAIAHVEVFYAGLPALLQAAKENNIPVYGTFLEGKNIYSEPLAASCVVVMGSEGKGISPEVAKHISQKFYIPCFSPDSGVESLNVATASAIVCSELRRKTAPQVA
ncbi:MAG: RNA methyltransferase [Prevotellaceae bacterium]|jgi:TrmH family RNA methyltransferase|nr:RNA methyltransferase [Prevotellaceae bacterium]